MQKVTYNKDGSIRKKGSGRKQGAKSFINISIPELQKFCGSASLIPVSRVWLEKMGAVKVADAQPTAVKEPVVEEAEEKIAFTLHR
jgi:hypothetical protein